MHHSTAVGLVEPFTDPDSTLQDLFGRQRPSPQTIRQGLAFQILHDQVVGPVLMADVMDGADMRMIQAGDAARFAFESLAQIGAFRQMAR
jgi:hypothetical protein